MVFKKNHETDWRTAQSKIVCKKNGFQSLHLSFAYKKRNNHEIGWRTIKKENKIKYPLIDNVDRVLLRM